MANLEDKLKFYREKEHLTKSELARRIEVSPAYITLLENGGKKKPSLEVLIKLSKAFNITYNELIKDTDIELQAGLEYLDSIADDINKKEMESIKEYEKLYNKIRALLEKYDYLSETDEGDNAIDDELITIGYANEEEILAIEKSTYVKIGAEMLSDIEKYKEMRVLYFLKQLKKEEKTFPNM